MQITEYTIELRDVHLYARHGVLKQEKEIGAWFTINITLVINDSRCCTSDDIAGTVSYAEIYEIICNEMEEPSNLLEHVCNRICGKIYDNYSSVKRIDITLSKDTPPMGGDRLKAAVTLKSER